MKKLFGTDGIRAIAGQSPLDAPTIYAIGRALGHTLSAKTPSPRALLGMDTRESSVWIAATLTARISCLLYVRLGKFCPRNAAGR